jgi:Family of unknown function (DUF6338)
VQLVLLVLLVLPGITYQFLRERWRGPLPGEREFGQSYQRGVTTVPVMAGTRRRVQPRCRPI